MQIITARNPAEGIRVATKRMVEKGRITDGKGDRIYVFDEPVMVHFTHPKECFVADPARDADPFKALLGAFWCLAGVGEIGECWRTRFGVDQIDRVITLLRFDPDSAQAVIQTYDARSPLNVIPRNISATFKIRRDCLDMLVTNHEGNLIDDIFGSDPINFAILQRVIADRLGIQIGKYWASCNHAFMPKSQIDEINNKGGLSKIYYPDQTYKKIVSNNLTWDADLSHLVEKIRELHAAGDTSIPSYRNGFLGEVVFKAAVAYNHFHKKEYRDAARVADLIGDAAWRSFCVDWVKRRAAWV